ncbi:MAG: 50S ribosomal protein L7/L12 [Parcubacteria group bacterium GW2011_GWA2_36_10]|nr:MAG: 50S ribosomal protein L7/L12 [Parcubacteria group bacterium GW2011_GWA2_36_10]
MPLVIRRKAETKQTRNFMSEEKKIVVPAKFKSIVEEIEKMSVLDLSELVSLLEDKFNVTASAPMAMAVAAPVAAAEAAEEKSSFNVELTSTGDNKIGVIKAIREVTQLGLKEAKDLADGAPVMVKVDASKEEAEKIKAKLTEAGATVTLK